MRDEKDTKTIIEERIEALKKEQETLSQRLIEYRQVEQNIANRLLEIKGALEEYEKLLQPSKKDIQEEKTN